VCLPGLAFLTAVAVNFILPPSVGMSAFSGN
jgi:hypothetical protein